MRLISLHEDAVRALERLRVPFDDVTPEGLWGSPYHLIGVTTEQRAVLDSWNLEVADITPDVLSSAELSPQLKESWPAQKPRPVAGSGAADTARPEPRATEPTRAPRPDAAAAEPSRDSEVPVPMHEEPKKHGDPLGDAVIEREIVQRAAVQAEQRSTATTEKSSASASATATVPAKGKTAAFAPPAAPERRDPTRLRVSVGGKYREASVQQGKILLDGQSFDSPAAATKSVAPTKGDWVFWEYFDADAGKWRMLDRDWSPSQQAS